MECPICEEGHLNQIRELDFLTYWGVECIVPLYYHTCSSCGSEVGTSEDTRKNKWAWLQQQYLIDMDMIYESVSKLNKEGLISDERLEKFYVACFDPDCACGNRLPHEHKDEE